MPAGPASPTPPGLARLRHVSPLQEAEPSPLLAYLVDAPTLVLHRRGDRAISAGHAEYLAEHIPNARLVLLPGEDTVLWAGDVDLIAAAIEACLPSLERSLS